MNNPHIVIKKESEPTMPKKPEPIVIDILEDEIVEKQISTYWKKKYLEICEQKEVLINDVISAQEELQAILKMYRALSIRLTKFLNERHK